VCGVLAMEVKGQNWQQRRALDAVDAHVAWGVAEVREVYCSRA